MIKQTFYNLTKEKQEELINILKSEITNKPITEISVATIANRFGIARSSLYNYFDNIEDLYYYILQKIMENTNKIFIEMINISNNDIFETFINFTNYLLDEKDDNANITKSIFLYSNSSDIQKYILINNTQVDKEIEFNNDMLRIKSKEDINSLFDMLNHTTMQILGEYFSQKYTKEQAKDVYVKRLEFIKNGVCNK